jgi:hypothetical protein
MMGVLGRGLGLVRVRILSTHIPIRIALPWIPPRALVPFSAPMFATPKMQKITTIDLRIPKRTAPEQITRALLRPGLLIQRGSEDMTARASLAR